MTLTELLTANPKTSIILISALVTLAMTLITKFFTNQNRIGELKKVQKTCKIRLKESKNNPEEMAKINKEMLDCSMELMRHSMMPMLFTFLPLILLISLLRGVYATTEIAKTWIWFYILGGVFSNLIFRKIFKVV
jgi:uncharacterized membrane protein (DUF106 family)